MCALIGIDSLIAIKCLFAFFFLDTDSTALSTVLVIQSMLSMKKTRLSFVLFLKISRQSVLECVCVCACAGAAQRPALCWWFRCMRRTMPCTGLGLHKSDPTTRVAKWSLWQFYGHNTLSWQPSAFLHWPTLLKGEFPLCSPSHSLTQSALWVSGGNTAWRCGCCC